MRNLNDIIHHEQEVFSDYSNSSHSILHCRIMQQQQRHEGQRRCRTDAGADRREPRHHAGKGRIPHTARDAGEA